MGKRVLLTSYTHSAVDNICLKLLAHGTGAGGGVPFVRVGASYQVAEALHPYTISHRENSDHDR
jgi:hypothetical protein